jgi:hypothetical protein
MESYLKLSLTPEENNELNKIISLFPTNPILIERTLTYYLEYKSNIGNVYTCQLFRSPPIKSFSLSSVPSSWHKSQKSWKILKYICTNFRDKKSEESGFRSVTSSSPISHKKPSACSENSQKK